MNLLPGFLLLYNHIHTSAVLLNCCVDIVNLFLCIHQTLSEQMATLSDVEKTEEIIQLHHRVVEVVVTTVVLHLTAAILIINVLRQAEILLFRVILIVMQLMKMELTQEVIFIIHNFTLVTQ